MSNPATLWMSDSRWRQLPQSLRRRVLHAIDWTRPDIVGHVYAATVADRLRASGEHALADELLEALRETQLGPRPGRPVEYPDRETARVCIDADLHAELRDEAERRGTTVRQVAEERLRQTSGKEGE